MTTSVAFPELVTNLVAALKAAVSLTDVTIFDGPELDETYPTDWIAIGHDGTDDGQVQAGQARNSYELLGNLKMMEDGIINCVLTSWSGADAVADKRTSAYALLSAVDAVIRTDPSFTSKVLFSGLESHTPTYIQSNAGFGVKIDFTIMYRART